MTEVGLGSAKAGDKEFVPTTYSDLAATTPGK